MFAARQHEHCREHTTRRCQHDECAKYSDETRIGCSSHQSCWRNRRINYDHDSAWWPSNDYYSWPNPHHHNDGLLRSEERNECALVD